jgi:hypothetical protein
MRARQITSESHKATGAEGNLQSNGSVEVLQRLLADATGISDMVELSTEQMIEILSRLNAARLPLQNLAKIRYLLQTVSLQAKIESGRITSTLVDLSNFPSEINILANEIQQHVDRILDDSIGLSEVLQSGVRELRTYQQQESLPVAELIQRTKNVLGPVIARTEALRAAARDIDDQYASFHRSTDSVVMSLQSEDIARQRVEHVQEVIRRVAASLDSGASMESCAGVLALQRSQLLSTRDLLAESIHKIHQGLESLGPRIQELVSRTAILAKQADEGGNAFATVIENELESVSNVFEQCSSSTNTVVSIVNSVLPSVEEMTSGAFALEEIKTSIRLISLNATIKTTQLGAEGIGMGVIASELQSITRESECDTRVVLDQLDAINEALSDITREKVKSESLLTAAGGSVVSTELAGLSTLVRANSRTMTAGLNRVRELAEELCGELEHGCNRALNASSITGLFDEQLRDFDEALRQLGYTKEMASAATVGGQTDELSKLYSMESERKLHLEAFGSEVATVESQSPVLSDQDGEFGDDVELF